jgi:hypothetical protein
MSEPLCAACGHPRDNHPFRHRFVGPSKDDTIKELEAKLAKAVEALRPFAEALKGNYSHQSDALPISMGHGKDDLRWVLPLGDLRRARALLAEIEGEQT